MDSIPNQYRQESKLDIYHGIIECLVAALEAKDQYTYGHSNRVADMSYDIGVELGLSEIGLEELHMAAHVHDIGKIGVSEHILLKEDKLSEEEWNEIKKHPTIGYDILLKSKDLESIARIVKHHHERWDGKGYPDGLTKQQIPFGSRIIAVCDSIDAMTSDRPYRKGLSWEKCMEEIIFNKERQFDGDIAQIAIKLIPKWAKKFKAF